MMELGVTGHLGQVVEVIIRCQGTEIVTIPIQKMEDLTVRVTIKKKNLALVKLMDTGEVGHLGHVVEVFQIVKKQDPEVVMEVLPS